MELDTQDILKYKDLSNQLRIKKEINNINLDIEKLSVREEIEEVDLSQEKNELKKRLEILNDEIDTTYHLKNHEILQKKEKISSFNARITKLEEKKISISENVYLKLKDEYETERLENISFIQGEINKINLLQDKAKSFIEEYNANKEELAIRQQLNELSEEEYTSRLTDLENKKVEFDTIIEITNLLLEELAID